MWKRAFIVLLSLNILVFVLGILWLNSFPRASTTPPTAVAGTQDKTANVQIAIGQDAINTYLEYALSEQTDVKQFLSYARVQFGSNWDANVGIILADRVVPFTMEFTPTVVSGNLDLQVKSASIGDIPVPVSLLFLVLKRAPWPYWITPDAESSTIDVNFTQRTPHPYGIQILNYSPQTDLLTLNVSIVPKTVLKP